MSIAQRYTRQARPRMHVYDPDGRRLGKVGRVNIGSHTGSAIPRDPQAGACFFEVVRGPLGLAGRYWVPGNAVLRIVQDGVVLLRPQDGAARGGRDRVPGRASGPAKLLTRAGSRLLAHRALAAARILGAPRGKQTA
ncbi:MAG: hypothetical protein M3Q29_00445 [Chloroflexota bacterium]|nr:hypothetical protein [Chloroflexota bacterium]